MAEAAGVRSTLASQDRTGSTIGRFAIRARLGAGGMGEVYLADDTRLKRAVALKWIAPKFRSDPLYRARLLREAERLSTFTHPHIAGCYDVVESGDDMFLVMEYVDGATLRTRSFDFRDPERFLPVAMQCAEALAVAHEKGIVHADIKPENIMLTPDGQVKVLDFGLAKQISTPQDPQETASITEASLLGGTPAYMPPELLLRHESAACGDVFSLGVVFYETLTGVNPFRRSTFTATADRVLHAEPGPASAMNRKVCPELDRMIGRMLEKDPADRYSSAGELLSPLRELQQAPTPPAIDPAAARRTLFATLGAALSRFRYSVVLVAVLLLASVLTVAPWRRWFGSERVAAGAYVALLPLQVAGNDSEALRFCDGLLDNVTARLQDLPVAHHLQIASGADSRQQRGKSVADAGRQLGVNFALVGAFERKGDFVRISLSLQHARTGKQLGAREVDGNWNDLSGLEDRLLAGVLELLGVSREEAQVRVASHSARLPGAREFYLRGRGYLLEYDNPQNVENAITLFQRALNLDPEYALAHAAVGEAYLKKYEVEKNPRHVAAARQACERALQLQRGSPEPHICFGTLHQQTGDYEQAAAEFRDALARDPHSDTAHLGLGYAYRKMRQYAEAEKTFLHAIELRRDRWTGYNWLGGLYAEQGKLGEAANMFQQVIRLTPDNVRGHYNLGGVFVKMGRYQDAVPLLENSLAVRPTAPGFNNLGAAYYYLRRFSEAANAYQRALAINSRDPTIWGNLAYCYYRLPSQRPRAGSTWLKAIEVAEEGVAVNPRDAKLLSQMARDYARLGKRQQALEFIQRALSLPHDSEVPFRAAVVHFELGQVDQGIEWLQRAVESGLSPIQIRDNPTFDDWRGDARFQTVLRKYGY